MSAPVFTATETKADARNSTNLLNIYRNDIKPMEDMYDYSKFAPGVFEDHITNQRPLITFLGPWSAGKTSFINHLLQQDYLYTGPEPTTSEFNVVMYGPEPGNVDGTALVNNNNLPFRNLQSYGSSFISSFKGFQAPHTLLRHCTLVDTPGVLESADDLHRRKYDYHEMTRWFVERSELVFVLFDPSKLDSGQELRLLFEKSLRGFEPKIRIILNKADSLSSPELMKVYGSLLWNLSGLMTATEPPRVYVGSFWNKPYREGSFVRLFTEEKEDLMNEILVTVPRQFWDRKVTLVQKRARDVLCHAGVVSKMRGNVSLFTRASSQRKSAIKHLDETYNEIATKYNLVRMEFPDPSRYEDFLDKVKLDDYSSIDKAEKNGKLKKLLTAIHVTLPEMLKPVKGCTVVPPDEKKERDGLSKMYSMHNRSQGGSDEMGFGGGLNNSTSFSTPSRQNEMMSQMMVMMQQIVEKKRASSAQASPATSPSSTPFPPKHNSYFPPPPSDENSSQNSTNQKRLSDPNAKRLNPDDLVQLPSVRK
ncbi:sarcoplasmic reticulum glycoprotein [Angomonas deanei]|uniref:Dynamin-type G domain-containing protein n=1 Tax=Angomonas deanei TaxID=59799 RepID=A0A7G2CH26_9TRYP|nr:sarcoplasmic reticulum glycoprotein [Angomonas deanei]CAD2217502.1 N-terminal EH-domain containing protein/Dynamin family/50S ribosome-binding GTPase/Domain of unknown function (DUF5600), putative [Angomonas deanei]|eukprot:EPY39116.1 sarcoplasmic reticulum glycoprotein [Angomonas deanei]